ncbi:type II toxin-antitoxin system RelE family toxin [Janibacter terrae]|uniref:type II toxin-antitoxin system RelE family toxin n=1 Tax=Janibacter terrae TaxID=103817 RepID=UPI00082CA70A|nr:type II toxin-antitoxin system RelE/ParE family toxin [Janibacter terrae]
MTYEITWSEQSRRALTADLPEPVAAACLEFVLGALSDNPHRVGKPLRAPLDGLHSARRGQFRVIYEIDDEVVRVHVVTISHRRDAYRT